MLELIELERKPFYDGEHLEPEVDHGNQEIIFDDLVLLALLEI